MNIRYPIYEGVYRILTSEEKRCTLLQYPVKLGTRSAESCTKVFVILWRVTASSFEHCKDNFTSVRCDLF